MATVVGNPQASALRAIDDTRSFTQTHTGTLTQFHYNTLHLLRQRKDARSLSYVKATIVHACAHFSGMGVFIKTTDRLQQYKRMSH